jgi:hypothetical protein
MFLNTPVASANWVCRLYMVWRHIHMLTNLLVPSSSLLLPFPIYPKQHCPIRPCPRVLDDKRTHMLLQPPATAAVHPLSSPGARDIACPSLTPPELSNGAIGMWRSQRNTRAHTHVCRLPLTHPVSSTACLARPCILPPPPILAPACSAKAPCARHFCTLGA